MHTSRMIRKICLVGAWICFGAMGFAPGLASAEDATADDTTSQDTADKNRSEKPTYRECTAAEKPGKATKIEWRHTRSKIIANTSEPNHTARDVVTTPNSRTTLGAKFSYGTANKDLEDEVIDVWIADCSGSYRRIGNATTDSDGRIEFELQKGLSVGLYSVYYRVRAEGTGVEANLRVLPKGTKFVVFDIDETLSSGGTTRTIWDVVTGSATEIPRPGAVETARKRYRQDYQLVYLTARPYIVSEHTYEWLSFYGFPPGTVRLVQDMSRTTVSHAGRANYKYEYLARLRKKGFEVEMVYGNATSDIEAYKRLGMSPENTYVLGEHGGNDGTRDLGKGFQSHLRQIKNEPPIEQPYNRASGN